jgi:hypothetical protein
MKLCPQFRFAVLAALFLVSDVGLALSGQKFGEFSPPRPQLEWLEDGRNMRLLNTFAYVDQHQVRWTSKTDSVVDGASIPRVLWSFVGGPFEGQYRNASIVHDTECESHLHEWKDVHRMFYNASRAGGVGWIKGMLMYAAVYKFGPRWEIEKPIPLGVARSQAKEYLTRLIVILRRHHGDTHVTLESLETLTYDEVVRQVPDNDSDLAMIRRQLAERERISTEPMGKDEYTQRLKKLDSEIYFDDRESASDLRIGEKQAA